MYKKYSKWIISGNLTRLAVLAFKVAVLTIQITIKSIERCNHSGSSTIDYGHKEIYEITDLLIRKCATEQ
ncbi:hypothetical protein QLX08_011117 [Tetragonisca angustula]|uniref:Uncharacterized protein n=1 Tax=Tetragonisca angustula TaxID=166442 RepID=A0AAW0Z989_9HYME